MRTHHAARRLALPVALLVSAAALPPPDFAEIDTDKNGRHSAAEIQVDLMRRAGFEGDEAKGYAELGLNKGFGEADANKDGKVDKTEFAEYQKSRQGNDEFSTTDLNGDGFHTFDEVQKVSDQRLEKTLKMVRERVAAVIKGADQDSDGEVSPRERSDFLRLEDLHRREDRLFNDTDTNRDGKHDKAEITTTLMKNYGFVPGESAGEYSHPNLVDGFRATDTNDDGVVTEEEYTRGLEGKQLTDKQGLFKTRDVNKDGKHGLQEQVDLDLQEGLEAATKQAAEYIKEGDVNKDGFMDKEEFVKTTFKDEL